MSVFHLALLFSEQRFRVTGFDIEAAKVKTLNEGGSCIMSIPSNQIQDAQKSGFRLPFVGKGHNGLRVQLRASKIKL